MTQIANMWSFLKVGSNEPKLTMNKGGYHNMPFHTILGNDISSLQFIPNKQFPNFINRSNPSVHWHQENYTTPSSMKHTNVNSSPPIQEPKNINNNQMCNSNKKKKKRRRRRKKNKQNSQIAKNTETAMDHNRSDNNESNWVTYETIECKKSRQRQLSTESDDSFVIFFEDHLEDQQIIELSEPETEIEDFDSSDSIIPHKKVRFADDSELCTIHPMIMWSYAYQAARKGPWEEYARDRDRFQNRVKNTEARIGHVFTPEHRSRIYDQRFA